MLTNYYINNEYDNDLEEYDKKCLPDLNFYPIDDNLFLKWLNDKINMTALNLENYNLIKLPDICNFNNLIYLNCSYNKLTSLSENLPDLLEYINCKMNNLKELPKNLPKSLKILDCSYNFISTLPKKLPISLNQLLCSKNNLTEIPETFPSSITHVKFNKNKGLYDEYPLLNNIYNGIHQLNYILTINEKKIKNNKIKQTNLINENDILYEIWCKKIYNPKNIF